MDGLWLGRFIGLVCAAVVGWLIGRSVPGWQADQTQDEYNYANPRRDGCLHPISTPWDRGGFLGSVLAGLGLLLIEVLAMLFHLFFEPWVLLVGVVLGYLAAVVTDQGPLRPRE